MTPSDAEYRHGLAGCLGGICLMLFAATVQLVGLGVGYPYGGGFAFVGFLIAIAGVLSAAVGVLQMERSARPSAT